MLYLSQVTEVTQAEVVGLEPGKEYQFRIMASNAAGDGPFSVPEGTISTTSA